jgi:hypothetical protein
MMFAGCTSSIRRPNLRSISPMELRRLVLQTVPLLPQPSWLSSAMARDLIYSEARASMSLSQSNLGSSLERRGSYSADVKLYLILQDGRRILLAQVGPDRVDLREAMELAPGEATLEIRVDDDISRSRISLLPAEGPSTIVPIRVA